MIFLCVQKSTCSPQSCPWEGLVPICQSCYQGISSKAGEGRELGNSCASDALLQWTSLVHIFQIGIKWQGKNIWEPKFKVDVWNPVKLLFLIVFLGASLPGMCPQPLPKPTQKNRTASFWKRGHVDEAKEVGTGSREETPWRRGGETPLLRESKDLPKGLLGWPYVFFVRFE